MTDLAPIARFELPDNWSPEGTVCAIVTIPDDPQYLSILTGLLDLLKWSPIFYRDPTKTGAATVARTWRAAIESAPITILNCEGLAVFDVRQNSENPCTLDKSTDGGDTWSAWANLQLCPPLLAINPSTGAPYWWNPAGGGGSGSWEPVPTGFIPGEAYPPVVVPFPSGSTRYEDDTARCFVAANICEQLKIATNSLITDIGIIDVEVTVILVGLAALLLFVPAGALVDIAIGLAAVASGATLGDLVDGQADINWPNVRDHLACFVTRDGVLTESGKADFISWMAGQYSGNLAWDVVKVIAGGVSAAGLTEDGGIPQTDIDTDCADNFCIPGCVVTFDAVTMPYTFWNGHGSVETGAGIDGSDSGLGQAFILGGNWVQGVFTKIPLTPGTLENVYVKYQIIDPEGNTAPTGISVALYDADDNLLGAHNNPSVSPVSEWTDFTVAAGLGWTIAEGNYIVVDVSEVWFGYGALAAAAITRADNIVIEGEGIC